MLLEFLLILTTHDLSGLELSIMDYYDWVNGVCNFFNSPFTKEGLDDSSINGIHGVIRL
jgi:hypothetical protein